MSVDTIKNITEATRGLSIVETLGYLVSNFEGKVAFSTSFGQEDQVITHQIFENDLPVKVFTLDTGRLFQETYDVFSSTKNKYKKPIEVFFPKKESVEALLQQKGPNSFYDSVENRKECCGIRKIEPLERALQGVAVWVTGLRGQQSVNRENLQSFEYDAKFNVIKYNPLIDWPLEKVETFLNEHKVPQNSLHKKGYISIGCAPCTRAIEPSEDVRAGRWWWESSHKECGLHA